MLAFRHVDCDEGFPSPVSEMYLDFGNLSTRLSHIFDWDAGGLADERDGESICHFVGK